MCLENYACMIKAGAFWVVTQAQGPKCLLVTKLAEGVRPLATSKQAYTCVCITYSARPHLDKDSSKQARKQ